MKTRLLYPLSYPITPNTNFYYFESPTRITDGSNISELIQKYDIFIDTEIPITRTERIIMDLKLHKRLASNNKLILQYKVLYHDKKNNVVVRADNNHPYPHIDLELPNKEKEKKVFDTDPSDYEASINTVLRYAEFLNSPMIGIDYWLYNLVSFEKELIYTFFNSNKRLLDIYTSFTDIARLVSVDISTADKEVNYDSESLARIIANKFIRCKRFEQEHGRPIKISKNLIQYRVDFNLLPFNITTTSDLPVFQKVVDSEGDELADEIVNLKGKTTYLK